MKPSAEERKRAIDRLARMHLAAYLAFFFSLFALIVAIIALVHQ